MNYLRFAVVIIISQVLYQFTLGDQSFQEGFRDSYFMVAGAIIFNYIFKEQEQ